MNELKCVAALVLLCAPAVAQAPYVQPMAPNGGNLRASQLWIDPSGQNDLDSDAIAWEDFELSQDTTITRVRWWGELGPSLGFRISFFNQDPGTIAVQPDMFAPGSGPISQRTYTNVVQTPAGGSLYQFDVDLTTPLTFSANTRYFISIVGRTPIPYANWNWAASSSGPNGTFWWARGAHMYFHLGESRALALATVDGWPLGEPTCLGDGSLVACPCGNNGASGHGCANSFNPSGALLSGAGDASVSADSVTLTASGLSGALCIFVQGTALMPPVFVDDGVWCTDMILRLGSPPVAGGASTYPPLGGVPVSIKGVLPPAGGTRYYQAFYRNAAMTFCPPATSNRTSGLQIVWAP
jgi:hypothetical protein